MLHKSSTVSVVFDFNASLNDAAPASPMSLPADLMRMEKSGLLMDAICVLFILSSQLRLSSVSVTFDFNAPLNDVAPLIPKMFAVDLMTIKKGVLVGAIVRVLLYLPLRLSFVSVVFDFNASSNDVAPASPMLFPVDLMRM